MSSRHEVLLATTSKRIPSPNSLRICGICQSASIPILFCPPHIFQCSQLKAPNQIPVLGVVRRGIRLVLAKDYAGGGKNTSKLVLTDESGNETKETPLAQVAWTSVETQRSSHDVHAYNSETILFLVIFFVSTEDDWSCVQGTAMP